MWERCWSTWILQTQEDHQIVSANGYLCHDMFNVASQQLDAWQLMPRLLLGFSFLLIYLDGGGNEIGMN